MKIKKIILNFILRIEMCFLSFMKIKKNRISFVSLESNQLESDFKFIYNQIDKSQYDVQLCLIHYSKNLIGQFLYFLNCMKQLYVINTSRLVIINNNNYVISHFKRKGVIVLQVWHACGAIKKFGNATEREYKISHYDYILSTSSFWSESYSQAFDVKKEHVLPLGLPRTDELFNQTWIENKKQKMLEKYPQLINKKVIFYAPTFRGDIYKGFSMIPFSSKKLMDELGDEYVFIYKYHPLLGNIELENNSRVINMNHEDTHELFCIADFLISDYSSIIFDFMILHKPILFYTPDLKEYMVDRGLFVDIEKLGYPVCLTENELAETIKQYPIEDCHMQENENVFFEYQDGKSTQRVVDFIEKIVSNENVI